jgi:hypothetical protein
MKILGVLAVIPGIWLLTTTDGSCLGVGLVLVGLFLIFRKQRVAEDYAYPAWRNMRSED